MKTPTDIFVVYLWESLGLYSIAEFNNYYHFNPNFYKLHYL